MFLDYSGKRIAIAESGAAGKAQGQSKGKKPSSGSLRPTFSAAAGFVGRVCQSTQS